MNCCMKLAQSKNAIGNSGKRSMAREPRTEHRSPVETLAAPAWKLPGGRHLAEFALRGGFLASTLLPRSDRER